MILDSLDRFILIFLLEKKKNTTTYDIAKSFDWKFYGLKDTNFLIKKNGLIKLRMKNLAKEGLIRIDRDDKNKSIYTLLTDRVILQKKFFPDDKLHKALYLLDKENIWFAVTID